MPRYRTEIVIPPDRAVTLQLPGSLPAGPAVVWVVVDGPSPDLGDDDLVDEAGDLDARDIEWWDDLDDDSG